MTTNEETIRQAAEILSVHHVEIVSRSSTHCEGCSVWMDDGAFHDHQVRLLAQAGLLRQEMTEERRFYTNAHVTPSVTFEQRRYVTEWEAVSDV